MKYSYVLESVFGNFEKGGFIEAITFDEAMVKIMSLVRDGSLEWEPRQIRQDKIASVRIFEIEENEN